MKLKTIFWDSHNIFIKPSKIQRLLSKKKLVILDTRTQFEYNAKHLKGSVLIKQQELKDEIIKHGKKLHIVVVGRGLRNELPTVSEMKKEGYHVRLIDRTLNKWDHMDMIAGKKSK